MERSRSFAETVIVEWAVSNDGRADLEPDNGTLIFPEVKNNELASILSIVSIECH